MSLTAYWSGLQITGSVCPVSYSNQNVIRKSVLLCNKGLCKKKKKNKLHSIQSDSRAKVVICYVVYSGTVLLDVVF